MKKIFIILIGFIILSCSSVDETSTNNDYYPWYDDYYYGYYDSYYYNENNWDDLSEEEKKEIIKDIKNNPEFQEYVKEKLEDRFPDGIPEIENHEKIKSDILNKKEKFDRDYLKDRQRPSIYNDNLIIKDRLRQPRTRKLKR